MGVAILILFGVIAVSAGLAFFGQRVGARMEEPLLGAGNTEQQMRSALTPSVLGALLGILPFIVFVIVLIWMATHIPPEHHDDGSGGDSSSSSH